MSKAEIVSSKLAAKKKEKEKINPAIPATTAAIAAAGGVHGYRELNKDKK